MIDLPAEIFYNIFRYLSRPEIQTSSHVCKKWNLLAVQVYRKILVIDDYKVRLGKLNLSSKNRRQYFRHGHLVRKLILKSECIDIMEIYGGTTKNVYAKGGQIPLSFSRSEFLLLLTYLPNIEEIDLTESGNFTYYITTLLYASLPHIKVITALPFESYFGASGYHSYFTTCFRFCDTLKSLYFKYTEVTNDYNYRSMHILDILSEFKNLKLLVFHNTYRTELIMFQIQELCPQLTELTFTSDTSNTERPVQGLLDQREEHAIKLIKSLQHLDINVPSLSIPFTRYLTSYLEDRLQKVNIHVTSSGIYDWMEEVGMEDALNLMKKLGQLNDVCIYFLQSYGLRRGGLISEVKMTKWFQVIDAFRGDKKALCQVKFCGLNRSQDYFKYSSVDNQLTFSYGLENVDYHGREGDSHIYQFYGSLSEFALPSRSISTIGPEIIDHLELNLSRVMDDFILKFLRYVFRHCVNLQYLKVKDHLKIQMCPNQRSDGYHGIRNNLKMVHFLHGAPSNNLYRVISAYLPDIEVLIFGSRSAFDLNFDLTLFRKLEKCYFVIQLIPNYRGAVTIKFEYTDGNKQRYYYDGGFQKTLVRQDIQSTIYGGRSFTFTCEKDIEFIVSFGADDSLLEFDKDELQGRCYRIPTYLI